VLPLVLLRQIAFFVPFDDGLDILVVDENFSTGLYIWQATRPYLGSPVPFSDAELIDQLFDGEEPFPRGCLILGCMPALRPAYHAIVQVGSVYTSAGAKHLWLSSHVSHGIPQMASPFHRRQFGDHPGA